MPGKRPRNLKEFNPQPQAKGINKRIYHPETGIADCPSPRENYNL
jgi:hypothetical protein